MNRLTDNMITSEKIQEILGYEGGNGSLRSVKKWCKENGVPLFKVGKRWLAHRWTVDYAFMKLLREEAYRCGQDGEAIVTALIHDDKIALAELMDVSFGEELKFSITKRSSESSLDETFKKYKNKSA